MPPSPALRCSPGRELRRDNHKRGRSLEGGILFREKDDDLALFNEMQTREKDNFLLQSNDDLEDIFSTKSRYFSDYKLGISTPARGESSDLLNADGEKNDYDWLLTPPDTPLFSSLDDEPPQVTLVQRGRPRSQPITISRSSTMDKSHRSSRGSASPNRLSPSPRSGNSTFQTRGRPSSAPQSSPTPSSRHATPTRRPSPPPSKPSTPASRSLTPTPRRTSTGSVGTGSLSGVRGTSPAKTSRGNSASPKIRAWQTNIPGFSLEAPPNLRTSLADRPASYVRGSSPASRNGRDSSSRSGRQSMSPTASRSVSSSHSRDRDRVSSHSKGSVASSGDDDVDSLQSVPMSSSDRSASRRVGAFPINKSPALSKKPTNAMISGSAPKRSFDSALRQMDHRKGPHNMFRPLLSSVPSSTFYVGKASAAHRAMISRNSSVTTSSNASSDQAMSGAHDTEGSVQNQDDSECGKALSYPDVRDDVFAIEKADAVNEDANHRLHDGSPNFQHGHLSGGTRIDPRLGRSDKFDDHGTATEITAASRVSPVEAISPETDSVEDLALCSRCGRRYRATELREGDLELCLDCRNSDESLTAATPLRTLIVPKNSRSLFIESSGEPMSFDATQPVIAAPESSEVANMAEGRPSQHGENLQENQSFCVKPNVNLSLEDSFPPALAEEDLLRLATQQVISRQTVDHNTSNCDTEAQQMLHSSHRPNLRFDVSEVAGISVLLRRSSSGKGPVVQGRTLTATTIPYDDPLYVRDGSTSMISSLGQGSTSASSSTDFGLTRQIETRVRRQFSGGKSDIETYRYDINTKHQHSGSSFSGTSSHSFKGLGLATSLLEENMEATDVHVPNEVVDLTNSTTQEQLLVVQSGDLGDASTDIEGNNHCEKVTALTSELSTNRLNIQLGESSVASFSNGEDSTPYGNGKDFQNEERIISDQEASAVTTEPSTIEEDTRPNSIVDGADISDVATQSSLDTISEIEIENDNSCSPGSPSDVSTNSRSTIDELPGLSVGTTSDKNLTAPVEPDTLDHAQRILEESTTVVEGHEGTKARSLTLEEATDAILFCRSIVHNMANDAATMAVEKENPVPLEGSWPTVTMLGNSNSDIRVPSSRTAAGRRTSKSRKARQRRVEKESKPPSTNVDSEGKVDASTTRIVGIPSKADSMKPPKLESKCNCMVM